MSIENEYGLLKQVGGVLEKRRHMDFPDPGKETWSEKGCYSDQEQGLHILFLISIFVVDFRYGKFTGMNNCHEQYTP